MIDLQPPAIHRVPEGAIDYATELIVDAQTGYHDIQAFYWVKAWSQIKRYDASKGIEPSVPQVIRWLVAASQQAQAELYNGELVAQIVGESRPKPFPKMIRPSLMDVGPAIWPYLEPYYKID